MRLGEVERLLDPFEQTSRRVLVATVPDWRDEGLTSSTLMSPTERLAILRQSTVRLLVQSIRLELAAFMAVRQFFFRVSIRSAAASPKVLRLAAALSFSLRGSSPRASASRCRSRYFRAAASDTRLAPPRPISTALPSLT